MKRPWTLEQMRPKSKASSSLIRTTSSMLIKSASKGRCRPKAQMVLPLYVNVLPTFYLPSQICIRYVPSFYTNDLFVKLQRMYQGTKSVEEYFKEIEVTLITI
ncbi:hypothetical protein CR513_03383, partial [Mucuna pruriens]